MDSNGDASAVAPGSAAASVTDTASEADERAARRDALRALAALIGQEVFS